MTLGISETIAIFIILFILVGFPVLALIWLSRRQTLFTKERDEMLRGLFGQSIEIYRYPPIPPQYDEVIYGGLHMHIDSFRELIIGDDWLFIQPTFIAIRKFALIEERNASILSLYSKKLKHHSPTFLIRNHLNKSFVSRYYQTQIENSMFIGSELNFDDEQSLFAERGKQIEALQIMSPELLEVLKNAPANADIIINKNQLHYILPGEKPIEKVLNDVITHSTVVIEELEDNLERWTRSTSNQSELESISLMPHTFR